MIQKIVQIQVIDIHHINTFVLDHLQFHDQAINLVLDIVILIENSTTTDLHRPQETLNFRNNEEIPYLLKLLLPPVINFTVLFLDPTLENDSILQL